LLPETSARVWSPARWCVDVALGEALRRRIRQGDCGASEIIDVTLDVKRGDLVSTPPYESGSTTPTVPRAWGGGLVRPPLPHPLRSDMYRSERRSGAG